MTLPRSKRLPEGCKRISAHAAVDTWRMPVQGGRLLSMSAAIASGGHPMISRCCSGTMRAGKGRQFFGALPVSSSSSPALLLLRPAC